MELFSHEIKPLQPSDIESFMQNQRKIQEITQKIKLHIQFIQAYSLKTKSKYVQNSLNNKK